MGGKITGTTVLWAIALAAGFLIGRQWLREQFICMIEETTRQAAATPPMDFDKPLEITFTEPILLEGVLYNPDQ